MKLVRVGKKVISWVLLIAMLITLIPSNAINVKAEILEGEEIIEVVADTFVAQPGGNAVWRVTKESIIEFEKQNRIVYPGDYDFLKIS